VERTAHKHSGELTIRATRFILIASTLVTSWLGMQAVHELGHVCGAWITGGRVARVVLYPLTFSRTDLAVNPHPLLVVWAGPMIGVLLPVSLWLIASAVRVPGAFVLRFFAGFCLVANGLYIAAGRFDRVGDCGQMLRYGSQPWQLWLFGAVATPLGLWLWHGQGRYFGLGKDARPISGSVAIGALVTSVVLMVFGFVVGGD
jgi:hypothetical protein